MRHFDETFWLNIVLEHFDETFWWDHNDGDDDNDDNYDINNDNNDNINDDDEWMRLPYDSVECL